MLLKINFSRRVLLGTILFVGAELWIRHLSEGKASVLEITKRFRKTLMLLFRDSLEAKSPGFKNLFPKGAKLERVATELKFTEGPVWFAEKQYLLLSDIPANTIYKLTPQGEVKVFKQPSENANGLTRDRIGRLIACEHNTRQVTRTEHDGTITALAVNFQGKRLNSPNDIVVKSDGSIYFTDPTYGIKSHEKEQSIQGVYRLSPNGEEILLLVDDFEQPNGLAFSPDESRLYIDDSQRRHIRVFDVLPDGTLGNGRIFYDLNVEEKGAPDGMKVDSQGHLYCTGAGGVWVFDSQGNPLGIIHTPEQPTNCAWGDDDLQTLYITAQTSVYKIRVNISGMKVY